MGATYTYATPATIAWERKVAASEWESEKLARRIF